MKTLAKADNRAKEDYQKQDDDFSNAVRRIFNGNPRQMYAFQKMLTEYVRGKIRETEASMSMAYTIALVDVENFGTGKKSTRLLRVQDYALQVIGEAYSHNCINANGEVVYDGTGKERLKNMLKNRGVVIIEEEE